MFPLDALNRVQRRIAAETVDVFQIKPELPGMSAVATLAGALGKAAVVNGATSGRVTHCNLFVIPGAPKSYGKGAAATLTAPLREASEQMAKAFRENEKPGLVTEMRILEKQASVLLNKITGTGNGKKPGGATTQGEREEMQGELVGIERRRDEIEPLVKLLPSYWIGNATSAALTEFLRRNGEAMFSYSPEAGEPVRIALGKFTKDATADFDLLLSGYTVESYRETRIQRGDAELTPCISVLWMCQPFLLREMFSNEEALERGLTARVLPFIVEHDEIPEDDGIVRQVSEAARAEWDAMVRGALEMRSAPRQIECSPEAREVFRAFHNEAVRLRNGRYRNIEGELGRWRENAIRLAGGQCVSDALETGHDSGLVLSVDHAERGVALARWCHLSGLKMLTKGMAERSWARAQTLAELLTRYQGRVTLRDLRDRHGFAPHEVKALAEEHRGMLSVVMDKPTTGRPSEVLIGPEARRP